MLSTCFLKTGNILTKYSRHCFYFFLVRALQTCVRSSKTGCWQESGSSRRLRVTLTAARLGVKTLLSPCAEPPALALVEILEQLFSFGCDTYPRQPVIRRGKKLLFIFLLRLTFWGAFVRHPGPPPWRGSFGSEWVGARTRGGTFGTFLQPFKAI